MFVMVADNWNYWVRELYRRKQVGSDIGVTFHFVEFRGRQLSRFIKNMFWNGQLTHVVKKGGCRDRLELTFLANTESLGKLERINLHAPNMTVRDLVLCIHSHCKRFDCGHV